MTRAIDIAADMQRQAGRTGAAIRDLPTGVQVRLVVCDGTRELSVSAPVTLPDDAEIARWLEAFRVPLGLHARVDGNSVMYRWPA